MTHDVAVHVHAADPPAPWSNTWTEERITLLIELRNTNTMSRSDIAAEINSRTGSQFTRSAVGGKIDRLFPDQPPEDKTAVIARMRARRWGVREGDQPRKVQPLAVVVFRPEDFAYANVRGVANLEKHHCRWIFGDDAAEPVYCGLPQLEGRSFCAGHSAIVYVPLQTRRVA